MLQSYIWSVWKFVQWEGGRLIEIQDYACTADPCPGTLLWELRVKHPKAVDRNSASCGQAGFSPLA